MDNYNDSEPMKQTKSFSGDKYNSLGGSPMDPSEESLKEYKMKSEAKCSGKYSDNITGYKTASNVDYYGSLKAKSAGPGVNGIVIYYVHVGQVGSALRREIVADFRADLEKQGVIEWALSAGMKTLVLPSERGDTRVETLPFSEI